MTWCSSCGAESGHRADCKAVEVGARIAATGTADDWMDRADAQHYAADIVAHVVELVLETHARAGTDLKSALEGMAVNYRAREPQAMRVVREALADADRRYHLSRIAAPASRPTSPRGET